MNISAEDLKRKSFTTIFAPEKMANMVLLPRVKKEMENGIYDNWLFYGPYGMGKSTLVNILTKDYVRKYVNASLMGKIDYLREDLANFCESNSVAIDKPAMKVLWFDELDGASDSFFDALRGFMDVYSHVRIMATCNKIHKIPGAMESRIKFLNFGPENDEERAWLKAAYEKRFLWLAEKLRMKFESPDVVEYICKKRFPDFRKSLKTLQSLYLSHGSTPINMQAASNATYEFLALYEMLVEPKTDPVEFHKYLMTNYADRPSDVILELDDNFVEYLIEKKPMLLRAIPDIIIENAKHQHMVVTALDQTTTMKSLCFVINKLTTQIINSTNG